MATLPPPVPIHKSPLPALSKSTYHSDDKKVSYLGRKRHGELLVDDSFSSSDESETDNYHTEEHKFWHVHASTTIISPSGHDYNTSIQMSYVPKITKKQRISLAIQVHNILGSTFDIVDKEIEEEWESSRVQLRKSLITLPNSSSN